MKAPLVEWRNDSGWKPFDKLEMLRREGEVDISPEELEIATDGTLEYGGEKMLVYIRDQYSGVGYKFHMADCSTLRGYQNKGRYDRYVASIKTNGVFKVNIHHQGGWEEEDKEVRLHVCKNCLKRINYKDYRSLFWKQREEVYKSFSIEEYFRLYKNKEQDIKKPKYNEHTAPSNTYTRDWQEISEQTKQARNYTCEACGINLDDNRKYLHTHHIDGIKSNNRWDNLQVLCIDCHVRQPRHEHMKYSPEYKAYQAIKKAFPQKSIRGVKSGWQQQTELY